ncbi:MAG: hypothetical protein Q9165_008759 [Trypethelium subeluteriae]
MVAKIPQLLYLDASESTVPPYSDPFHITARNGYLPSKLPSKTLSPAFDALTDILDDMPIQKEDGRPGLLANFKLGPLINSGKLPDLTHELENLRIPGSDGFDLTAITAAFRDYSFVASSYLLEPCWETYSTNRDNGYGLGRQILPSCIAGPLVKCAGILDIPAFMSYAASYALYNYYLVDPAKGHDEYTNIRLIRAFEKGLDPTSSEAGFILTHIHMVAQTGPLIEGAVELLTTIETSRRIGQKTASITENCSNGLEKMHKAMTIIETNMERMWANSLPREYMTYRTFIYGITKQSMFPNGVIYEGQWDNKPQFFRGESGANDAIIPLLDHVCEIPFPENPLTKIYVEFREYRPKPHRNFLTYVRGKATAIGVRELITTSGDLGLVVKYLRILEHVRSFRWRHWMFAREYILKHTLHPIATGGSPIITWLPNQLGAVMDLMEDVANGSGLWAVLEEGVWNGGGSGLSESEFRQVKSIMDQVVNLRTNLRKEVAKYCAQRSSGY